MRLRTLVWPLVGLVAVFFLTRLIQGAMYSGAYALLAQVDASVRAGPARTIVFLLLLPVALAPAGASARPGRPARLIAVSVLFLAAFFIEAFGCSVVLVRYFSAPVVPSTIASFLWASAALAVPLLATTASASHRLLVVSAFGRVAGIATTIAVFAALGGSLLAAALVIGLAVLIHQAIVLCAWLLVQRDCRNVPPGATEIIERTKSDMQSTGVKIIVLDGVVAGEAWGLAPWPRFVILGRELIERAPAVELRAILAHELSHLGLHHSLKRETVLSLVYFAVTAVSVAFRAAEPYASLVAIVCAVVVVRVVAQYQEIGADRLAVTHVARAHLSDALRRFEGDSRLTVSAWVRSGLKHRLARLER